MRQIQSYGNFRYEIDIIPLVIAMFRASGCFYSSYDHFECLKSSDGCLGMAGLAVFTMI